MKLRKFHFRTGREFPDGEQGFEKKGEVHPCIGTEALYRLYGP